MLAVYEAGRPRSWTDAGGSATRPDRSPACGTLNAVVPHSQLIA